MRIGVPRETKPGENRVAVTAAGVRALRESGAQVVVETGAGVSGGFEDREYRAAGGSIVSTAAEAWSADLVVKVKEPLPAEFFFLSKSCALFTFLHLAACPQLTEELLARRVTAIAYETVVSGGALPILRPMSEVAGALSIQVGARGLERGCGGRGVLLPATGGSPPGDVAVLGAGVAGRTAARIAAGIGANVTILDVNPEKLSGAQRECGGKARTIPSTPEAVAGIEREGHRAAVVEAALIDESGRKGLFEAVISVTCDRETAISRLAARDGMSRRRAEARLRAQMDPDRKAGASEYVIDNSGDIESTRRQVVALAGVLLGKGVTRSLPAGGGTASRTPSRPPRR